MCNQCDMSRPLKALSKPRKVRNPFTGAWEIRHTDHVSPGFKVDGTMREYQPTCWETRNRLRDERLAYLDAMRAKEREVKRLAA